MADTNEPLAKLAKAASEIAEHLWSPNEADQNGEAANVVDGLYEIARAIYYLARAVEGQRLPPEQGD